MHWGSYRDGTQGRPISEQNEAEPGVSSKQSAGERSILVGVYVVRASVFLPGVVALYARTSPFMDANAFRSETRTAKCSRAPSYPSWSAFFYISLDEIAL